MGEGREREEGEVRNESDYEGSCTMWFVLGPFFFFFTCIQAVKTDDSVDFKEGTDLINCNLYIKIRKKV